DPPPLPPVPAELLPSSIPYNPSPGSIVLSLVVSIFLSAPALFFRWPFLLLGLAGLPFMPLAVLLYLRPTRSPRQILLSDSNITIPTGFLRLRPTSIHLPDIEFVWVAPLGGGILCAKTPHLTIEIPASFLPDRDTFHLLHYYLNSFVK